MEVQFYDNVEDSLLKFSVIIAISNGKWVFCKHKERNTYEIPGGHRESNELIEDTARRELMEETGAVTFKIEPICVYSVTGKTRVNEVGNESFGKLFYAEIDTFDTELHSEIYEIVKNQELSLILFPHGCPADPNKANEEIKNNAFFCETYMNAFHIPVIYVNSIGKLEHMPGKMGRMMGKSGFLMNGRSQIYSPTGNSIEANLKEAKAIDAALVPQKLSFTSKERL